METVTYAKSRFVALQTPVWAGLSAESRLSDVVVFSNDPAQDTLGGLLSDFNQYDTIFANAGSVQGSGNGLVYRVSAPPVIE